jgi:hypothetical protein
MQVTEALQSMVPASAEIIGQMDRSGNTVNFSDHEQVDVPRQVGSCPEKQEDVWEKIVASAREE